MKNFLLLIIAIFTSSLAVGDVKVDGYYRKDGTYVQPHYRSDPNGTKSDNWTTKGNINPYTEEIGTRTYDNYNNYGRSDGSSNDGYRDNRSTGHELPGYYGSNGEFYHDNGNIYKPYIELEENDSEWIGRWRQDSSDSQTYRSISEQSTKEKEEWTVGVIAFAVFIVVGIWGGVSYLIGRVQYFLTGNESIVETDYYSSISMVSGAVLVACGLFYIFM